MCIRDSSGKVEQTSKKTKWFKSIQQHGVVVHVWPLKEHELEQWLKSRLQQKGLTINQQGVSLLANSVEGNLLAASQEVDKLYALYGTAQLSVENILESVADNARYDVFKLTDSLLVGNSSRAIQVLNGLIGEKLAAPVVLWGILRDLRLLASLSFEKQKTGRTDQTFTAHRWVWGDKQRSYLQALPRGSLTVWHQLIQQCATVERIIKGVQVGDEWTEIEQIFLRFCYLRRLKEFA